MSKQLLIRLLAALAAFVLIASACGGDDDDQADGGDTADGGTSTEVEEGEPTPIPTPTPPIEEVDNEDLSTKPLVEVPAGDPPVELQLTDLVLGEGEPAAAGDYVITQYVGVSYSTGLQFDASWDRGQPFGFVLGEGNVIEGWDDGIVGMAPGGRRELVIPPEQAYGESGSGSGSIGPNETLIFVVDIVGIVPAGAEKPEVDVPAEALTPVGVRPTVELPDPIPTELDVTDLAEGEGDPAGEGDMVAVRFVGIAASDGSDVDSAWGPGQVRTATLGDGVLNEGLEQAIEGMSVGGRRSIVVPPELGFGAEGNGLVGPDETIVYELELVGIQRPDLTKPEVTVPDEPATELGITDLVEGSGPVATRGSTLVMQYVGVAQSTDEEFDASWERSQPFTFTLGQGQVIRGWDDGIEGMAVGGRRELVIPGEQAYGEAGSGDLIGPDETLVFVVDLVGVASSPQVQSTDLIVGEGAEATVGSRLFVHYVGVSQSNGEQFDSSWDRGIDQPFPFVLGVGQVIPGWDQGLIGMQVGGRRELVIPPDLAYGDVGAGDGVIAPNETLVFVVDLIAVS